MSQPGSRRAPELTAEQIEVAGLETAWLCDAQSRDYPDRGVPIRAS